MSTQRKALILFGVCAVLYLVVLPALPDTGGLADDLVWLLGVIVAAIGRRRSRRRLSLALDRYQLSQ